MYNPYNYRLTRCSAPYASYRTTSTETAKWPFYINTKTTEVALLVLRKPIQKCIFMLVVTISNGEADNAHSLLVGVCKFRSSLMNSELNNSLCKVQSLRDIKIYQQHAKNQQS